MFGHQKGKFKGLLMRIEKMFMQCIKIIRKEIYRKPIDDNLAEEIDTERY